MAKTKKYYLLGIGGIAMVNLAGLLKEKGHIVSGSDLGVFGPSALILKNLKIPYFNSYKASNVKSYKPDAVVIGNAISRGNEELEWVLESGTVYKSMPETIREELVQGRTSTRLSSKKAIVVTGTSGKTTTAALISWILHRNKLAPTALVGGIIKNLDAGFLYGKGDYIVLEGDEYNSSFYDSCPKFLHYQPYIGIVNNIEQDHVDIYPTVDDIIKAFRKFIKLIPRNGRLILNKENANAFGLKPFALSEIDTFGKNWNLSAKNIKYDENGISFEVYAEKKTLGRVSSPLLGRHNAENILAATLACLRVGLTFAQIAKALEKFHGVKRRLEIIHQNSKMKIIDDFAHNPEKVAASLSALKMHFPKSRLIAIFEPRTASSRRKVFQAKYPDSFKSADIVYIAEPYNKTALSASELFSSKELVDDLNKAGTKAYSLPTADKIVAHIKSNFLKPTAPFRSFQRRRVTHPTIFCIMSSGNFDGIHQKIISLF